MPTAPDLLVACSSELFINGNRWRGSSSKPENQNGADT